MEDGLLFLREKGDFFCKYHSFQKSFPTDNVTILVKNALKKKIKKLKILAV